MQRPQKADPDDPRAAERAAQNTARVSTAIEAVRPQDSGKIPSNSDMTLILLEMIRAMGGN